MDALAHLTKRIRIQLLISTTPALIASCLLPGCSSNPKYDAEDRAEAYVKTLYRTQGVNNSLALENVLISHPSLSEMQAILGEPSRTSDPRENAKDKDINLGGGKTLHVPGVPQIPGDRADLIAEWRFSSLEISAYFEGKGASLLRFYTKPGDISVPSGPFIWVEKSK